MTDVPKPSFAHISVTCTQEDKSAPVVVRAIRCGTCGHSLEPVDRNVVKIHLLTKEARIPCRGTSGSAGWDLYASESTTMGPGSRIAIHTGLQLEIPPHLFGMIKSRSSRAMSGEDVIAGVIDSDYRGEVLVCLHNDKNECRVIEQGMKIGQLLLLPRPEIEFRVTRDLSSSERDQGGFGSTGE